jgi:acetyl esterase/lipase
MKRFAVFGFAFVLMAAPPLGCAGKAQERQADVRLEKDLVYGKGGDTELQLNLAMPKEGDGPFPAVVCIHGGGWIGGKRQDLDKLTELVAAKGYVAVTVTYRFAPAAKFPAQIEDCKAAVRWLRANGKKYKIDAERIGATGFSAGGHLVCLLGTTNKDDGLEGMGGNPDQSSAVQAVASFFGPTDFTAKTWNEDVEKKYFVPFLGGTFADKPEAYKRASPVTYVKKGMPPFMFFHGTEDKLVNVRQSRLLCDKLKEVGGAARVIELQGAGHGWGDPELKQTMEQMQSFFDEHLKKAK